jgi:signal transduction histidine kinase
MLVEKGYEVRPVISGRQALAAVERDPPDLILLDISMSEMNGYELCARLKARPELEDIPVIFLTALSDVADKVKAFEVGGIDYITKPFQVEEVRARVHTHLTLRRANAELAQSYRHLQALEKLRNDLVHMVVHDMRSPLMALQGHLKLLEEGVGPKLEDEAKQDLFAASFAARALTRMANDLLDVSRLEEGKMPLERSLLDLRAVAQRVALEFAALDRERAIAVDAAGQVMVDCDGELVRRVLENLVSNAIKHTPAGEQLDIVVQALGGKVRVAVADRGAGVPLDARRRIFDKFVTMSARSDPGHHSVGLGLAFCKLAVEAHGGTIGVEDFEPHGSVFWFELPVRSAPLGIEVLEPRAPESWAGSPDSGP